MQTFLSQKGQYCGKFVHVMKSTKEYACYRSYEVLDFHIYQFFEIYIVDNQWILYPYYIPT